MELTEFSNYFFGSNLFAALLTSAVTVGVGLLAFVIYNKQNSDKKKDAASIVLLEIKNAETHLALAKEVIVRDKVLPESTFAMKTSSWQKYSYLFVRDFTAEEWNLINTFYEKCRLYDEAVDYNNTFYKKNEEQIRINLHTRLSEYTGLYLERLSSIFDVAADEKDLESKRKDAYEEFHAVINAFADNFMERAQEGSSPYNYAPRKAFLDGEAILATIRLDMSTSTIGTKLEAIINQNLRSRLFDRLLGVKSNGD